MGYAFATSPCIGCGRMFSYNPMRVPSTSAVTGQREPICRPCFNEINRRRAELNLPPFELQPGAYEPCPEEELY